MLPLLGSSTIQFLIITLLVWEGHCIYMVRYTDLFHLLIILGTNIMRGNNNTYINNKASLGGVYYISSTMFSDLSSTYKTNIAANGKLMKYLLRDNNVDTCQDLPSTTMVNLQ